jgi:hypothetical protein
MEEILLNVDSRYRNILMYPNECKYKYNFDKMYKNIVSARMISIEVNNSTTYIDDIKQNNFITVHLPNKINDPIGTKIELDEGLYQFVSIIQNIFNGLFQELFNVNSSLKRTLIDGYNHAEKYFYFLYLNEDIEFTFDFNSYDPLTSKLTLNKGWYSIYGIVLQIQNYITSKYNERKAFKSANPSDTTVISFDSGNFSLDSFQLSIFDRRFRHETKSHDCVRYDTVSNLTTGSNNLTTNLNLLKEHIYGTYINDTTKFILQTTYDVATAKILDKLSTGNYLMTNAPDGNPYTISTGMLLTSQSIYYLNKAYGTDSPTNPTNESTQIYNLIMNVDLTSLKTSFSNFFTKTISATNAAENFGFYYYFAPIPGDTVDLEQTWNKTYDSKIVNSFDNLFSDKDFAYEQGFITQSEKDNPSFVYTSEKDIADFEIDFSTYQIINHVSNGFVDIKKIVYPPVGYYLGFRPNINKTINQFTFKGSIDNTERNITATKIFDTNGNDYMFLRLNNWGYLDFFGKTLFAKILLTTGIGNPKIEDLINKEFRFRQPIDIDKLDIELVDYLGNTINLSGFDWSFTLELNQIINSTTKTTVERNALVFNVK